MLYQRNPRTFIPSKCTCYTVYSIIMEDKCRNIWVFMYMIFLVSCLQLYLFWELFVVIVLKQLNSMISSNCLGCHLEGSDCSRTLNQWWCHTETSSPSTAGKRLCLSVHGCVLTYVPVYAGGWFGCSAWILGCWWRSKSLCDCSSHGKNWVCV